MAMEVLVETSARHVHVTQEVLETLFGAGYALTKKKDLSQPGQFACEEKVDIVGPKNTLKGIRVLGPARPETQVEVARIIGTSQVQVSRIEKRALENMKRRLTKDVVMK